MDNDRAIRLQLVIQMVNVWLRNISLMYQIKEIFFLREKPGNEMKISEIIPKDKIIPELKGVTKEEIINELIGLFYKDDRVYDIDALREDIFKREKIMSTGVGDGLAIPHCRTEVVKSYIAAFGKSGIPVDFDSIDHKPAFLFFFVAGNDVKRHMQLLSLVARFMSKDFKEKLMEAKTSEEIHIMFQEFDKEVILPKHI